MLETEVKKLTAAIVALEETIQKTGSAPSAITAETPKASPAPSAAAAEPSAPVPEPTPAPEPAPDVEVTKKELADKTIEVAKAKGRETALAILSKYGASKVPELTDETKWPAVYAELQAALTS